MEVWVADVDVTREHVFLLFKANGSLRCRCCPHSIANRKMCFRHWLTDIYHKLHPLRTFKSVEFSPCLGCDSSLFDVCLYRIALGYLLLALKYVSIVPNITEMFSQHPPLLTMEGEVAFDWRCSSDQQVNVFLKEHAILYSFNLWTTFIALCESLISILGSLWMFTSQLLLLQTIVWKLSVFTIGSLTSMRGWTIP